MGQAQATATESYLAYKEGELGGIGRLSFTGFPYLGMATTYSANRNITCSSASGTALATGFKTNNSVLGLDPDGGKLRSYTYMMKEEGYRIGIMSNVPVNHATPASFYANAEDRADYYEISLQIPETGFDYFAGDGFLDFNGKDGDLEDIDKIIERAGYTVSYGMKEYEAKTLQDALEAAEQDLHISQDQLNYEVIEEFKGLFKKSCSIKVLEDEDAKEYAKEYLEKLLESLDLHAEISISVEDGVIHLNLTAEDEASKIIGRGGENLNAFTELVRSAVYTKFKKHFHLLININNYKDQKYEKLVNMAKRLANTVRRTKASIELDPMPSDERRIIHNALADDNHIKTLSVGVGKQRHITIQYVNYVPKYEEETEGNEIEEAKNN